MEYEKWLASVPPDLSSDSIWRLEVYRLSLYAGDLVWQDASKLVRDRRTTRLAGQLYRAVGSIGANIAEGYSRRSGRDQARYYEYALGSAREARVWYYQSRKILGDSVTNNRTSILTRIIRLLLRTIPLSRGYNICEPAMNYEMTNPDVCNRDVQTFYVTRTT
jgi:four helix bundle protein